MTRPRPPAHLWKAVIVVGILAFAAAASPLLLILLLIPKGTP